MEVDGQDIDLDAQPPITELIREMQGQPPTPTDFDWGRGGGREGVAHPERGGGGASRERRGGSREDIAHPDRGGGDRGTSERGGGERRGRGGGGGVPRCTDSDGAQRPADYTRAVDRIRNGAALNAYVTSCPVPETLISAVSNQLRDLVNGEPGQTTVAPVSVTSSWGTIYRWTIVATVRREQRCAGPSQVVQGETETTTERRQHTTDRDERTQSSSTTHTAGLSAGATTGDEGVSAGAEAGREQARTRSTTGESTYEGGQTQTQRIATHGPVERTEEMWDYTVDWSVRAEVETEGDWSLQNSIAMLAGVGPFTESGSTPIGTRSVTREDTTPEHAPARGRGRARRPQPPPGPVRIVGHGG